MFTTLIYRCPTSSSCITALTWDLWDYSEKNDHLKFSCRKYQFFGVFFRFIFEIEEARLFIPALKIFTFDHLTTITISKLTCKHTWACLAQINKLKAAKNIGSVVFTSVKSVMTLLSTFTVPFHRNRHIPSYNFYFIHRIRKYKGIKHLPQTLISNNLFFCNPMS